MKEPQEIGLRYLNAYGILQAMFLQQDATKHLSKSLNIKCEYPPELVEIRDIRNKSVGHPTEKDIKGKKGKYSYFSISRFSISKNGFTLIESNPEGGMPYFKDINIPKLVNTQNEEILKLLSKVLDRLKEEEMEHKEGFRDQKLEALFIPTLSYYFTKIYEAIHSENENYLEPMHTSLVQNIVANFRNAINERGLLAPSDHIQDQLEDVEYSLTQLNEYFSKPSTAKLNKQDAHIFAHFAENEIDKLKNLAKEIDQDYEEQ